MKIPIEIEIEVINTKLKSIEKEFLLGLKIFHNKDSYYNFPQLKTNEKGKIIIKQNDIIENTAIAS